MVTIFFHELEIVWVSENVNDFFENLKKWSQLLTCSGFTKSQIENKNKGKKTGKISEKDALIHKKLVQGRTFWGRHITPEWVGLLPRTGCMFGRYLGPRCGLGYAEGEMHEQTSIAWLGFALDWVGKNHDSLNSIRNLGLWWKKRTPPWSLNFVRMFKSDFKFSSRN